MPNEDFDQLESLGEDPILVVEPTEDPVDDQISDFKDSAEGVDAHGNPIISVYGVEYERNE